MNAATRLAAMPLATRRAVAVLLLVLALLLAWGAIVLPARGLFTAQREWRIDAAREIARDRGIVSTANQLREAAASIDASPLRTRLYEVGGAVAPGDQLEQDLRAALLASGVEPTNFKVLPAAMANGLHIYRVEFSSIMAIDQLRAFFQALELQPRHVRIERLKLDAPSAQHIHENPRVTVLMEARGYSVDAAAPAPAVRVARAN